MRNSPLLCLSHPPLSSHFFKQEAPVLPLHGERKTKEPGAVLAVGGYSCLACEQWLCVNSLQIFWPLYPSQEFDSLDLIFAFVFQLIYKASTGKGDDEFAFSNPNHNSGFDVP